MSYNSTWIKTENNKISFSQFKSCKEVNFYASIEILNEYGLDGGDITMREKGVAWNNFVNEQKEPEILLKEQGKKHEEMELISKKLESHSTQIDILANLTQELSVKFDKIDLYKQCNQEWNNYISEQESNEQYNITKIRKNSLSPNIPNHHQVGGGGYHDEEMTNLKSQVSIMNQKLDRALRQIQSMHEQMANNRSDYNYNNNNDQQQQQNENENHIIFGSHNVNHIENYQGQQTNNNNYNNMVMMKMKDDLKENHEQVQKWLINLNLEEYIDCFIKHGYEDLDAIQYLDMESLKKMGIDKVGHQKKLLMQKSIDLKDEDKDKKKHNIMQIK